MQRESQGPMGTAQMAKAAFGVKSHGLGSNRGLNYKTPLPQFVVMTKKTNAEAERVEPDMGWTETVRNAEKLVEKSMKGNDASHDAAHVWRVRDLALSLAREEGLSASPYSMQIVNPHLYLSLSLFVVLGKSDAFSLHFIYAFLGSTMCFTSYRLVSLFVFIFASLFLFGY